MEFREKPKRHMEEFTNRWLVIKYISIMGNVMLYGDPDVMSFTIVILHSTFLLLSVYRFCVS